MRILFLSFSSILMFATPLIAALEPRTLVVKVYSYQCSGPSLDYRGSGLLFRANDASDEILVLTSEHVLIQGRRSHGICHHISVPNLGQENLGHLDAEIKISDWQAGLAILKVSDSKFLNPKMIPTLESLVVQDVVSNADLVVLGYPYAENVQPSESHGNLSSAQSIRHLLPNNNNIYEISGAHGEFGMSGGPVLTKSGQLMGVLSHQFLKMRAGATGIGSFSDAYESASDLIAIRATDVLKWFKETETGEFKSGFIRDFDDQLNQEDVVYSAGLKFAAVPQDESCSANILVSDMPGHDPVGVGGHDPIGIGGVSNVARKSIQVHITRDRELKRRNQSTAWKIQKLKPWISSLEAALLRAETIVSPGLLYRPNNIDGVSLVCVKSLEEFFRKVVETGVTPLTHRMGNVTRVNPPALIAALNASSKKTFEAADELRTSIAENAKFRKLRLLDLVMFYSALGTDPYHWQTLQHSDLALVTCVTDETCLYRRDWTVLFNDVHTGFKAQKMLEGLLEMKQKVKELTL